MKCVARLSVWYLHSTSGKTCVLCIVEGSSNNSDFSHSLFCVFACITGTSSLYFHFTKALA